jgi:hypothetical protein
MGRHGTLFLKKTTSGHPGTGWTTMGQNHDLMQKKTGALYALRSFYDCETQD